MNRHQRTDKSSRNTTTRAKESKPQSGAHPAQILQRLENAPGSIRPADVLTLQRSIGNRATGLLLQAKLKLGPAGDRYEQEADRVAQQVVHASRQPDVQRAGVDEDELQAKPLAAGISQVQRAALTPLTNRYADVSYSRPEPRPTRPAFVAPPQKPKVQRSNLDEDELQAKPKHGLEGGDVDTDVARSIQSAKGGGAPLHDGVRSSMEQGFGADFCGVRVHTGGQADALNRSLNARAFTTGNDIFFGKGQYNPGSSGGQELIAHELTHTVQQGAVSGVQRNETPAHIEQSGAEQVQRWAWWDKRKAKKKGKKEEEARQKQNKMAGREQQQFSFSDPTAMDNYSQQDTTDNRLMPSPLNQVDTDLHLATQAKSKADQIIGNYGESVKMSDVETARARETKGIKSLVKRGQRADASVQKYGETFKKEIQEEYDIIQEIHAAAHNPDHIVYKQYGIEGIAQQMQEALTGLQLKVDSLEDRLKVGEAKARMMDAGEYAKNKKPFDWSSVELSASDAAMALDQNRFKISAYYSFLKMDYERVTDHVAKKAMLLNEKSWAGPRVVRQAIASGMARGTQAGTSGKAKPLSDSIAKAMLESARDSAFSLDPEAQAMRDTEAGSDFGAQAPAEQSPVPQGKGNKYIDPSLRQGKGAGAKKALTGIGSGIKEAVGGGLEAAVHPFKKNIYEKAKRGSKGRSEVRHLRLIQGLELMATFHTQAQMRMDNAQRYLAETEQKYQAALNNYDNIDTVKEQSKNNGDLSMSLDSAIVSTGEAWKDVTQTAIYRSTLKQYKLDILEESKKYEKFGERAMVSIGRKAKAGIAGVLGGAVLGMLTGGLYRIEKTQMGGGYDVKFEGRSFIDDFKLAVADYQKLAGSATGEHVRGLGGKRGAKAYGVLQIVAKALGLLKSIATTLAIFIPPGAPVLMSIALYSAVVKAALELVLMIWAGIGSANTKDPRSRGYLKGKIAEHGLQFGTDAATVATVGTLAGLSSGGGAWTGKETFSLFDPKGGPFGEAGKTVENWSQNINGKEHTFGGLVRPLFDQSKQVVNIGNAIGSGIGQGINDPNVRNMTKNIEEAQEGEAQKVKDAIEKNGAKPKMAKVNKNIGVAFRVISGGAKGEHGKRVQKRLEKIQPELAIIKNATQQMNEQVQTF